MPENNEVEIARPDEATAESNRNPRRSLRSRTTELGSLEIPYNLHELSQIVVAPEIRRTIEAALHRLRIAPQLESVWGLSRIEPNAGRCILNFYGPPGTGKTMTAGAIARHLDKPLFRVDYSAVVSKYLGDTAKHIVRAFEEAAQEDAVLFFDEADSLVSKRVPAGEACSSSINQNRNTLMQELDQFGGVVVLTTNLFENYDPAMLRRITYHVEFTLPRRSQRKALFELHLPNRDRVRASLEAVAIVSQGLSGGDIRNVCLNAIYAASMDPDPAKWVVTETQLRAEIDSVLRSKRAHERGDDGNARMD